MGNYLKLFNNHTQYETFVGGGGDEPFIKPNVSHCIQENHVHYNPYYAPIIATFTISAEKAATPTQLYEYYVSDDEWRLVGVELFEKIEIDGSEVSISDIDTAQGKYQLSEGVHTVKYYLINHTLINNGMFDYCQEMTSVIVPKGIETIGEGAFESTFNLETVTLPNTLKLIKASAFNSSGLESVVIPDSVEEIEHSAFFSAWNLKSIHIGKGVKTIGSNSICEFTALEYATVDPQNTVFDSRNNCNAIIETATNTLICGSLNTVIPNGVVTISGYAFAGRTITSIGAVGSGADIEIPSSVTRLGSRVFENCNSLTSATLPEGVEIMEDNTFRDCSNLVSVTLPSTLKSIGNYAFWIYNCSLTTITCNAMAAPTIESGTFYRIKEGGTLYVPQGSTGYDVWMGAGNDYLGKYNWTKVEQ